MNTFNDSEILKKALVGVEFEFYSNLAIDKTAKEIGDLLGKKIQVEEQAHSDFVPTADHFKLEPDMSGGAKLMELVTGPVPYYSARLMIINVCSWIEKNGYTNDRSSIHLNISFDKKKIEDKNRISKMNVLKFILDFKENQVFKFFPERKDSAYAKSIKFILPNKDTYFFDGKTINQQNFIYPDSKYYGINFEKRHSNYLEFRYIGGADWEKKTSTILHMLDSFLVQLWNSTGSKSFTDLNALELKKILAVNKRIIDSRRNWREIEKNWKHIQFSVDLNKDAKIVDIYWANIKEQVMRLFTHGAISKGHINYDTDTGRVQVKDGKLSYCVELDNYDFINCHIRGEVSHSDLFQCQIEGSDIDECNFYDNCQINSSKVKNSYIHKSCHANDAYIYGTNGVFKGSMKGGIFREGKYDKKTAKFDNTEKVLYQEV